MIQIIQVYQNELLFAGLAIVLALVSFVFFKKRRRRS